MATVAAEAEEVFEKEGRVVTIEENRAFIPSAATWKPTQQSNSGRTSAPSQDTGIPHETANLLQMGSEEEPLEDLEHLQLTLPEAWFLIWTMDSLTILNLDTVRPVKSCIHAMKLYCLLQHEPMSLTEVWDAFLAAYHPLPIASLRPSRVRFDNPFLVNYVAYHHYRSLGWVIKGGIKFCVDLLLYKRGPVFSHAECVYLKRLLSTPLIPNQVCNCGYACLRRSTRP
jgi:tRNA-splicing endonuclease subunit Sen2